ncbi:DUF932 domain-containing protein [Janthinobacterium sp. NKUCC06_STL]|uniref:DUF932 domain-containing protein n=1 Tax=Janthinobacterium sp. NKUCC06_STL TaxID=2842127 RepID=UPI001C5B195F|nr:DUF932 domain-containing protein [Janthinobacterium sp. NKUCC06_STL]MBW3512123.1 DUF932 domain-containing protein [Janthinobacterium sp. NKUCC06_STL]
MKEGRTLKNLAAELARQLSNKKDMIVPSMKMRLSTSGTGHCTLLIDETDIAREYPVNDFALRQISDKHAIPYGYFERMRLEKPMLLDQNVNTWLHANPNVNRLVRTLDGRARAFLTDRYRRIDNWDLANFILPILDRLPGARFESVELTDSRMFLKVVTDKICCEVAPGDIIQAGVVVSNSEIGHGKLRVEPLIYRLVCRNGMIAADRSMRKTHLGRKLISDDENVVVFQDDTLKADDHALFLKVRDMVETAVSQATFQLISAKMQKTMGIKLIGDPVKSVEVLANRFTLNDDERGGVLRHLVSGGDLSGYGLLNAMTGYSQDISDYDRATAFEEFGGHMLDFDPPEWKAIATAA